jgi:prepilin-type N-terminal cleavage/methylation domain-containing protein
MFQQDDGFTLIETIAALMILALSAAVFYRAMETGTQGARLAYREANALLLAQSRLDEAVALGSQSSSLLPSGQTSDGFSWATTFADPAGGVMRVDVRVTWRDGPARADREIALTTLIPVKRP